MPRIIPVSLETHFGLPETTFSFCWRITPRGGTPEGYTALDVPLRIGGLTFQSSANVLPTALPSSIGLDIDGVDVTLLWDNATAFSQSRVEARLYDGALVDLFAVNWAAHLADPGLGFESVLPLLSGRLGGAQLTDDAAIFELLPWSSLTNTSVGRITSDRCDCPRFGKGRCKNLILGDGIQIALHGRTVAGQVIRPAGFSPSGMHLWLAPSSARPNGWSNWGVLRFTSGLNRGAEVPIKLYRATGEVFFRTPVPEIPSVGDTFEMEEGCERSRAACLTKEPNPTAPTGAGNILNFQGFSTPGQSLLVKTSDK